MLQKDLYQVNSQNFQQKKKEGLSLHCDPQQLCNRRTKQAINTLIKKTTDWKIESYVQPCDNEYNSAS